MTAGDLAQSLNVSKRTIYRDVETLSLAGIPIYTIEGRGGGIGLDDSYRVSLAGLNRQEVQALFVAGASTPLHNLGLSTVNETTLLKLLSALSSLHQAEAERVRQRIYIDPTHWFSSETPSPFIHDIQEAALADRVLQIDYQRTSGETFTRTIDAYGMVAKSTVWYLVGAHDGRFRSYRVSRIINLQVTGDHFVRQPDFDLIAFWREHTQAFVEGLPTYPVTLWIEAEHREWVSGFLSVEPVTLSPTDDPDWLETHIQFDTREQALTALLSIVRHIRIIDPPDLRDHLLKFGQEIVDWLTQTDETSD